MRFVVVVKRQALLRMPPTYSKIRIKYFFLLNYSYDVINKSSFEKYKLLP